MKVYLLCFCLVISHVMPCHAIVSCHYNHNHNHTSMECKPLQYGTLQYKPSASPRSPSASSNMNLSLHRPHRSLHKPHNPLNNIPPRLLTTNPRARQIPQPNPPTNPLISHLSKQLTLTPTPAS